MLSKLEMRCLKVVEIIHMLPVIYFGRDMKRKEHLTPHRAGGKCLIKSATSEKCLDIAIRATSIKSHSCAILETFYICYSFIFL